MPLLPQRPFVYHIPTVEKETWEGAVERFANSRTMRHRPALRQLFQYLARKTLAGQAAELKEYVIGLEAFHKPPGYDPQKDASIRVQISRLRQCLGQYYEEECPGDPVRLEIPKGQFEVTFRHVGEAFAPQPAAGRRWGGVSWAKALVPGAVIVVIIGLALSWRAQPSQRHNPVLAPELVPIWGSYIDTNRAVLVVLGTPLFTKYTTAETGVFFRDPRLNDWNQAAVSPDISKVGAAVGGTHTTPSHIYTGVGEAIGAFQLGRLLARSPQEVLLRRGHALSWDDFKDRNVIVLGAPKHNLHLNHLPVEQEFAFVRGGIQNRHPQPGELPLYGARFSPGFVEVEEDHALISRFPGLHGAGETTVLAGSSTEGTLAAVEFATQPRYAAELTARLRQPGGAMPRAYQVVVQARFQSQTPVEIRYIAHRLLQSEPAPRR